jgi:hypothetical protein
LWILILLALAATIGSAAAKDPASHQTSACAAYVRIMQMPLGQGQDQTTGTEGQAAVKRKEFADRQTSLKDWGFGLDLQTIKLRIETREQFKSEFDHDMDGLGTALKDFTVDNKK